MYILAVHLKHFRSFDDLWVFPNRTVNVIVGPNNCGKTSLLKAIALVLDARVNPWRSQVVSRFDFHNIDLEESIEISVWLKPSIRRNDQEVQYLETEEVRATFFDKLSEWLVETDIRTDYRGNTESHPSSLSPMIAEPMATELPKHESLLAIQLCATWDESREVADVEINIVDQTGKFLAKLGSKHRDLLGFTLLPSDRRPVQELSLSYNSILSKALDKDEVTLALRQLLLVLEDAKQPLIDQESVRTLFQHLESLIAPRLLGNLIEESGGKLTLTFLDGELWRLRGVTSIAMSIQNRQGQEVSLPLDYQGRGAQNLMLMFHLVEMLRNKGLHSMIALEEPEQNLEPSLAKCAFGEICSLSEVEGNANVGQIFVTTHSPALVNELKGPDSLLIFTELNDTASEGVKWSIISGQHLSQEARKRLDQRRERYVPTLFSRQVLIVEGDSEVGFLPVAFRHFSRGVPDENPYHLGLEVVNGDSKSQASQHAGMLRDYGRSCHLLLDYDGPDAKFDQKVKSRFGDRIDFVTCWPKDDPLAHASGCDLEIILAAYTTPSILFEAIKNAYEDAGHPLIKENWEKACQEIDSAEVVAQFPEVYGNIDLKEIQLESIEDEQIQRAFLYALLHGPHCCKSVKDMRIIASVLAQHNALPTIFDDLRRRIVQSMTQPKEINHDNPYLTRRS